MHPSSIRKDDDSVPCVDSEDDVDGCSCDFTDPTTLTTDEELPISYGGVEQ